MLKDDLRYIGIKTFEKPLMQIDIDLSNHCNYACTYCGPAFNGATSKWQDYKKIIFLIESVQKTYPDVNIFLQLKGGEPTQWPSLHKFLDAVSTYENIAIGIITNLSRTKRFWEDLNFTKVSRILASFHAAQADSDQFIENAKVLYNNQATTTFSLMLLMDKPYFKKIIELVEKTKKLDSPYNTLADFYSPLRILLADDSVTQYNEEEELTIKKVKGSYKGAIPTGIYMWETFSNIGRSGYRGSTHYYQHEQKLQSMQVDYRGWKCYAGMRKLSVFSSGDIYAAQCKIKKLGNINTRWKFNKRPVNCTIRYCTCLSDIQIPKYKPNAIKELFISSKLSKLETTY
jgi:organic radical activating enzyme